MNTKLYTVKDVAIMTKRSERSVKYWIKKGYLTGVKVAGIGRGGQWRFTEGDIKKFLTDRHVQESFVQNHAGVKTIPETLIYRDKIRAMIEDAIRAEIQRAVKEAVSSVMNDIIAA